MSLYLESKKEFRKLFMELYNPLCNFVNSIVKDQNTAEDVVQDVFIHVWENRNGLNIENVKVYFFQASKNKAFEYLRKKKLDQKLKNDQTLNPSKTEVDVDAESYRYLKLQQISNSIRQLPPKCREVFLLHRQNGLSYKEIAEELNISVKTVENHISNALKILRERLNPRKSD